MSVLLGHLIYTSFPKVGFKALTSAEVSAEIQKVFVEKIVYQHWDSYNPPDDGYRAAYIHQISADQILFGWLYNDGTDDFGRSHVPYFVCYFWAGLLDLSQLELIFHCLSLGPIAFVDRQYLPNYIESVTIPGDGYYQPVRSGVSIPSEIQTKSQFALQQGNFLKLLASEEQNTTDIEHLLALISPEALANTIGGKQVDSDPIFASAIDPVMTAIEPAEPAGVEAYREMLLTKARALAAQEQASQTKSPIHPVVFRLGILVGALSFIALILGGFQIFRMISAPNGVQQSEMSAPQQNPVRSENLKFDKTLAGHSNSVWSVVLSADGKSLISGSEDKTIKIWNVETGSLLNTLSGHTDVVRSLVLAPNGRTLISGSGDQTVKIWDLQSNVLIQTLDGKAGSVWSVALSPNQQTLVSGTEEGKIQIWNFSTGQLLNTIRGHEDRVFSVTISPDGKTLATASLDQKIKIWDLQTGQLLRTISGHSAAARSLAFSPDGKRLASASWDKTIKLWNWQTGELIHPFVGHTSRVVAIAFSPDGQTLVSSSTDNTVNLWSVQDGKLLRTLDDHSDWVLSVAINSDKLVSGSKDRTISVWQVR